MKNFVTHIPDDAPKTIACKHCGLKNNIPWDKMYNQPFVPVTPNDFDPLSNNRTWIPTGLGFRCERCSAEVYFELPTRKKITELHLFGDESYDTDSNIFTYTLAGADYKIIAQLDKKIVELKSAMMPGTDPLSWTIHMKDLWSSKDRAKHPVFNSWTFEKVWTFVNGMMVLLASIDQSLFVYSITLTKKHPFNNTNIDLAKHNCYTMLLLNVIDEATSGGAQPKIYFDSEKNSATDHIIHQWATENFTAAQRQLIYTYLAKGISIPEPLFIKPATRPCSEIADFISFWIRRYHVKKEKGQDCEIDIAALGKITYYGFTNTGELLRIRQKGFPWKEFYEREYKIDESQSDRNPS